MAERDYSGRCLYASVLYITDENCSCIDYRLVSDRNYMILYTTYAAVGIPCVLIKF